MKEPKKGPARPANPFRTKDRVLVTAHRGGGGLWPENTLFAFKKAAKLGVDILETDVHATADGQLVLIHDDNLDRVTNGTGPVASKTLAELKQLDAGYRWSRDGGRCFPYRGKGLTIPTLVEVLSTIPDIWLNIDIKPADGAVIPLLVDTLRAEDVVERILVGSFHNEMINSFRRACPEVVTATHPGEAMGFFWRQHLRLHHFFKTPAVALQVPDHHKGWSVVLPGFIRRAHRRGLAVHVWTINDPDQMRQLIDWGVDAICTDHPDRLLEL